jgi:hypothetical protein
MEVDGKTFSSSKMYPTSALFPFSLSVAKPNELNTTVKTTANNTRKFISIYLYLFFFDERQK